MVTSFAVAVYALLAMCLSAPRLARRYWLLVAFTSLGVGVVSGSTFEYWMLLVGATWGAIAYVVSLMVGLDVQERNLRVRRFVCRQALANATKGVN